MQEILDQIFSYLRGIWRYRWLVFLVSLVGSLIGWAAVVQLQDRFTASARVYVDTNSILKPLLSGLAVDTNPGRKVALMTRTIRSRPNLEKIARMSDLDLDVTTPEDMEFLLDKLANNVALRGTGRENLYTLNYTDSNPRVSKLVVQSMLTLFVESNLGQTREGTDSAQRFIDQEIAVYERRLEEAEERSKEFKRKNIAVLPGKGGGYYQRLTETKNQLRDAELELQIAQDLVVELSRQLEGEEPVFGFARPRMEDAPTVSRIDARIDKLQAHIDELLLKYTDAYPDVQAARQTIAALEKERLKELEVMTEEPKARPIIDPVNLDTNPVYQQLRISSATAQADVTAKKARVNEFGRRVAELQKLVDTVPQIEAELKRLDRDYAVNKQHYLALLDRRESARLAEKVEVSTDGIKFRVVDPPRVPLVASDPNRPLLFTAALLASLVAGIGLAFLVSQIRAVFDNGKTVTKVLEVPVLGEVVSVATEAQRLRDRFITFAYIGSWGVLLLLYGGLLALHIGGGNPLMEFLSR